MHITRPAAGAVLLVALLAPSASRAQSRTGLRVGPGVRTTSAIAPPLRASVPWSTVAEVEAPGRPSAAGRPDTCAPGPLALRLLVEPPAGVLGGAAAGWIAYTFGVGALASDHGAEYRRGRRTFVRVGAAVGLAMGLYRLATVPTCAERQGNHPM